MYGRNRSGIQNPMWGKKHKESTRDLIKQRHHNVSGSNNPKALKWKLTSPSGEEIICHGNIETLVSERNISMVQLKRYLGEIVPILDNKVFQLQSRKTIGWKLEKI